MRMKIDKNFVLREIAGDYIIVPTGNTALTFNGLITVNEVGAFLWELLQKDTTEEKMLDAVLEEYDVDENTARIDIREYVEKLERNGILERQA